MIKTFLTTFWRHGLAVFTGMAAGIATERLHAGTEIMIVGFVAIATVFTLIEMFIEAGEKRMMNE
jgi:hypothetical protein